MDGFDLSSIDQIDQDMFDTSPVETEDDDDELPLPDAIGIDSALQDDEKSKQESVERRKSRSRDELQTELNVLKTGSLRRQILEKSLSESNKETSSHTKSPQKSHVMNIVEKAGMQGIDKERINQIIHEASKGSLFYQRQAQRQAEIHATIQKKLELVRAATQEQVIEARSTCDQILTELKKQQTFNRVIVHFDLDMFFAAVEVRDNPSLKDKPVAVGGNSMVSTSNYVARRFGVRAAMPGFIARKLCPNLILIRPSGSKYRQASSEVFEILERYDPDLAGMSLDEAYLDLTDYIQNSLARDGIEHQEYYDGTLPRHWWIRASEVVDEIREAIFNKTKLTCSAGISCNTVLAKISTDINKPNGQYMVRGYPKDISTFIGKTPVEKVSGIGKVSAQLLHALEINTCGDIFEKRHLLPLVFHEINIRFYLKVSLGDGSNSIKSDEDRKSKSVERTFSAVKETLLLLEKLDSICEELCNKYLKPYRIKGRTITIKLKRNTFVTTQRSHSLLLPTNDKEVIYAASKNLLLSEVGKDAKETPDVAYRLLGVKVSNLNDDDVQSGQLTIDAMLRNQGASRSTKSTESFHRVADSLDDSLDGNIVMPQLITQDSNSSKPNPSQEASRTNHQNTSQDGIGTFFRKRLRTSNESHHSDANADDNESQREGIDINDLDTEDFQCPYCFRPVSNFIDLENHVNECRFKISIDVNRSLIPQRSQATSFAATRSQTQAKQNTRGQKLKVPAASQNPSTSRGRPTKPSTKGSPKTTFFQQFLESNSQSLSQAKKVEPYRCPYCYHGFLDFGALDTHVVMCTKRIRK